MHAIVVRRLGGPEVLRLEEVPLPHPGPGEVLVRLYAAGVNPADTYVRSGIAGQPSLPYTPGDDAAGVVAEVGAGDVARAAGADLGDAPPPTPGQRVYLYASIGGTYAEYALCRPQHVLVLPDGLSFAQGAAIGVPYGTAYRALFQRADAVAGETVLVHGASGAVGLAAVQLAAAAGLFVIATGGSEEGRRLALENGATHALDHNDEEHFRQALALTEGRGIDVLVESRSDVNLGRDLTVLAQGGRVVCVGNRGPGNQGEVSVNARDLMRREADVRGVFLPGAGSRGITAIHAALAEGLADGTLKPIVSREFPLAEAARAHEDLMSGHSLGKFVLLP
jgi:NADPH:quinone reductase